VTLIFKNVRLTPINLAVLKNHYKNGFQVETISKTGIYDRGTNGVLFDLKKGFDRNKTSCS
jgi:hypothetical protein